MQIEDVLKNFLNFYIKKNLKNEKEEIKNEKEEEIKNELEEINKNFEKIIIEKENKNFTKISNNLKLMISEASINLSNILFTEEKYYGNNGSIFNKLKKDFFGGPQISDEYDLIFDKNNFHFKNKIIDFKKFNNSFFLAKIKFNNNDFSFDNFELDSYYQVIFKNIFWFRTFLIHGNKNKNLDISLAILSLILINGLNSKISFNNINNAYNNAYRIKFLNSEKEFNTNISLISKIADKFIKEIKNELNKQNITIYINHDLKKFDELIIEVEKAFNLNNYKNLIEKIDFLKENYNSKNQEELSFLYQEKNLNRQQYLKLFYQWNLLIFNLESFLDTKLKLISRNEKDEIIFNEIWNKKPDFKNFEETFKNFKIIFNGQKHNKHQLFYTKDRINDNILNFEGLIKFVLNEINLFIKNLKRTNLKDWFFLSNLEKYKKIIYTDKKINDLEKINNKTEDNLRNDHKSIIISNFKRLIHNFKKSIFNVKNKKNYFIKKKEYRIEEKKLLTKEIFNKRLTELEKYRDDLLRRNSFDMESKNIIFDFFEKIKKIKKIKFEKGNIKYLQKIDIKNINFRENNDYLIQFIGTKNKNISREFKDKLSLINFIKKSSDKLKRKLFLYYKFVLKYEYFNEENLNNKEILKLVKNGGILENEKYYIYNLNYIEKIKSSNYLNSESIKNFFQKNILPNLIKYSEKKEDYINWLKEWYYKNGFKLFEKNDQNLMIFDFFYQNNNKRDANIEIENKYWNLIKNEEINKFKNKNKPFNTLILGNIKKNVVNFSNCKEFKDSFYNGKTKEKDNFNQKLFDKYFSYLKKDYFDIIQGKFEKKNIFNLGKIKNDLNEFNKIKNKFLENNENLKNKYFSNLNLDSIKSFRLRYISNSDILSLKNYINNITLKSQYTSFLDKELILLEEEFNEIWNLFSENKKLKNDYYLIYKNFKNVKDNNYFKNHSKKTFNKIKLKGTYFEFKINANIEKIWWTKIKDNKISECKNIENIEIINKINNEISRIF